ncbi:MAG: hypothetical protein KKE20_01830 [Nanoarchaeota archaeon]|nr:hypothetical protein [Nanoarchaeota archaeon]
MRNIFKQSTNIFVCLLVILSGVFLLSSPVHAQSIDEYSLSFHLAYGNTVVEETMIFKEPVSGNILLNLPSNRQGLLVKVDGNTITQDISGNILNLKLVSSKEVEINYVSDDFIEGNDFIAAFKAPDDISNLTVSVTLPENAVLVKPLSDSTVQSGSAYPKPSSSTTDGQSISLIWTFHDLNKDDEKSFFVMYQNQTSYSYLIGIIILLIIIVAGFVSYLFLRKTREAEKTVDKIAEKPAEHTPDRGAFEKHLKEDEEQIVNILKQRENKCEQGTLRVITGFSKAKLSGLLKELEDRKIIHKEKRGKKNLVFLREQ